MNEHKKMRQYQFYDMKRMFLDFSPELLAQGAEWYLSEEPEIKIMDGLKNPEVFWIQPGAMRKYIGQPDSREEDQEHLIYKSWYKDENEYPADIGTELCIHKTRGVLVRTWCNCKAFRMNNYSCKHVAGLAVRYLVDEKTDLKGSPIESFLKKQTGVEDPFIPGRLKKTSAGLQHLLKKKTEAMSALSVKPAWQAGVKSSPAQMLHLDIYTFLVNGTLAVELRVGTARTYQIKQLEDFLDACEENRGYSFSSRLYQSAGLEYFDSEARRILEYLIQLKNARLRRYDENFSGYTYDSYYRYDRGYESLTTAQQDKLMLLFDHDLDRFMELMDGKVIYFSDSVSNSSSAGSYTVDLEAEPSPIRMRKREWGADIYMEDEQVLACGFQRMYLRQKQRIVSLPAENWETRRSLAHALEGKTAGYVSDQDLPGVLASIYEAGGENQRAVLADFEIYRKDKRELPLIRIYLDYPQENMITCKMQACYPAKGKKFDLFEQKKGVNIRNLQAEQAVGEAVWSYFDAWDQEAGLLVADCNDDRLYLFLSETIPALSQYGEVMISDQLKRLKVTSHFSIQVGIQVDAGSLLMSLHSGEISKEEIIEVLCSYNPRKKYTRLKNGNFLTNDENNAAVIQALAESFRVYGKNNPEAMRIPLFRALYIEEMFRDRENIRLEAGEDYSCLLEKMKNPENRNYEIPENLKDILRPYQTDGYRWIRMLKTNGFGGILADDMGLGKTMQVLSCLLAEKMEGESFDLAESPAWEPSSSEVKTSSKVKTLIITPASLIYNWQKEIRTFTSQLSCYVMAGTRKERKLALEQLRTGQADYDIYITSYDLLKRDIKDYEGIHFTNQILDEAQYIKNQGTQTAKAVRLIDSSFRMALTGTPIENRLSELWSIFDFIMPGFLYSYARFRQDYESPVVYDHDPEVMDRLRRMVHPFILRRLKKDVLKDLPDKLEEDIFIRLEGEQRKVYDAYAKRLKLYLDKQSEDEYHQSKLEILAELTKLRQICCGPELFLENYKGHNAKLDACMELIYRSIDGGHKLLLFSQFTRLLDRLGERLKEENIPYYRIDGSTSKTERMMLVDAFQSDLDTTPVFCISLKAGGTGLNLTAADIVIHYDPWWNLAAQNQATDRTHRIGQTNRVTVYNLIAEDSIEEQITSLQKTKAQLAEDILSGEGIGSILIHKEDLMALL